MTARLMQPAAAKCVIASIPVRTDFHLSLTFCLKTHSRPSKDTWYKPITSINLLRNDHYYKILHYIMFQITEYLLIYRVNGLESVGKLFPNLARIRGLRLLNNFALIVYDNPKLTEVNKRIFLLYLLVHCMSTCRNMSVSVFYLYKD